MIADIFLILYIGLLAIYWWMLKYRYKDVIAEYVKVKIKCLNCSYLSAFLSFLS